MPVHSKRYRSGLNWLRNIEKKQNHDFALMITQLACYLVSYSLIKAVFIQITALEITKET